MCSTDSPTQFFYDWLDLTDAEQTAALGQLRQQKPALHAQVLPLIHQLQTTQLAHVFTEHANDWVQDHYDYSGQVIDKYRLHQEIGRGGLGLVYSATRDDNTYEQQLAIKLIQPHIVHHLDQRALFTEAQILARLNHPGIAKVYDGGLFRDQVYIVMERIEGQTLDAYLQQQTLSVQEKLKLFIQVCQAVEHAHDHHILHADLKPENILIDAAHQPKLIDFNLTQKLKQNTLPNEDSSLLAFSDQYASPEQKQGDYLTQQSDVYSLGKILQCLFPRLRANSDLQHVVEKAIAPQAEQRYLSVGDLRHDLEHILALRPISLKQHQPVYVLRRLIQRRPFYCLLVSLLLASGASFTYTVVDKNHQLSQEKKISENMLFELTQLLFHSKDSHDQPLTIEAMLAITRLRVLSNPDLPQHIKQKMLLALITPVPTPPDDTALADSTATTKP